jgi:hypothetical protein
MTEKSNQKPLIEIPSQTKILIRKGEHSGKIGTVLGRDTHNEYSVIFPNESKLLKICFFSEQKLKEQDVIVLKN